MMFKYWKKI